MDLEMTSLMDVHKDAIIEIAVVLTDAELTVVAEGPDIVIHAEPGAFAGIPEGARAIHEASGIIEAAAASAVTAPEAERTVLDFIKEHCAPQTAPLCGNSIYMDRYFLRTQMRTIDEYLFYRCIDVSTIKELMRRWRPAVYAEAAKRKGESAHRAKDDILASISELRFYRGALGL